MKFPELSMAGLITSIVESESFVSGVLDPVCVSICHHVSWVCTRPWCQSSRKSASEIDKGTAQYTSGEFLIGDHTHFSVVVLRGSVVAGVFGFWSEKSDKEEPVDSLYSNAVEEGAGSMVNPGISWTTGMSDPLVVSW